MNKKYSVLMSVYIKENPAFLQQAMDSIWNQSVPTDDFTLVCDGPLTSDLDAVIKTMYETHPKELTVVRLKENNGLGYALNEGIKYCKNELVARMDSDDISRPNRCEKQLAVFDALKNVGICSGSVEEFSDSISRIEAKRVLPEYNDEIVTFSKKRNPFNHPCVMYKKSEVELAGGYQDFYLLEDYYLWIRMIQNGSIGYNLQEPILWMRAGPDMYKRRSGLKYAISQEQLFKYMKDTQFISFRQYLKSILIRGASSVTPNRLREYMFKTVLRK